MVDHIFCFAKNIRFKSCISKEEENMRKGKRAFTITELVIVIAVIAILAAVLIPTFTSLINKANESSDIQAVREMNQALIIDEVENGKPDDVGKVADILREIGYDVRTYRPLASGSVNYWYKKDNRVVLYNSNESKIVFPEEYKDTNKYNITNDGNWSLLNQTYTDATMFDFDATGIKGPDGVYDFSKITDETPSTVATETTEQYRGRALYSLAVQINEEKVANDVTVKLPEKVELPDFSWTPIKQFEGTMEPADDTEEVVISNLNLTESVLYSESTNFSGSGEQANLSKYNVYGFINSVTGETTIKNITFEDVTITSPGSDFNNVIGIGKNANVVAPIGAIIPNRGTDVKVPIDVTIENVHVKGATIRGIGRAAGLVGYIGGFGTGEVLPKGSQVKISNCSVTECEIEAGLESKNYGSAGGLISYVVRVEGDEASDTVALQNLAITIENCIVKDNVIKGYYVGGMIGWFNTACANVKIQDQDREGLPVSNVSGNNLVCTIAGSTGAVGEIVGKCISIGSAFDPPCNTDEATANRVVSYVSFAKLLEGTDNILKTEGIPADTKILWDYVKADKADDQDNVSSLAIE